MQRSQTVRVMAGALAAAALLVGPAAWAGTGFLTYEGWDSVQQGKGGEKKVVAGVDFWMEGSPPRRFKILGSIDAAARHTLMGRISFSSPEDDVAKQAQKVGGDAVIVTDSRAGRYVVVKYLPDSDVAATPYEPLPPPTLTARY
jgi:hypothetical protein